jgi:type I restriction enzyme, S subunit
MSRHRFQNDTVSLLQNLPSDWREERIHDVAELRTSNVDKKSEEGEKPVKLCNYVDVYKNDRITSDIDFMDATATDAQIERFSLRVGDVVITKDSETPDDIGVPALIAETFPDLVCGYHLTILRPYETLIFGGYLFYALASHLSAYQFYLAANGVTRFGLTYQGTKNVRIAFPLVPEQQQIAAFLDWKTGQIDALIARKKELLEKLKEKRIAVITRAVTKGLNSAAPMRDSGIAWLGEVPKHWKIPTLKMRYTVELGKMLDGKRITGEALLPYLRNTDVQWDRINYEDLPEMDISEEEYDRYTAKENDVLVCEGGEVGRAAVVVTKETVVGFQKAIHRLRAQTDKEIPRFLFYTFYWAANTGVFSAEGSSTIAHLTAEQLRRYQFPQPPLPEQTAIAAFLDRETGAIARMMNKVESAIDRLTEYRTALITAATTGKIDVRNVKVPVHSPS